MRLATFSLMMALPWQASGRQHRRRPRRRHRWSKSCLSLRTLDLDYRSFVPGTSNEKTDTFNLSDDPYRFFRW